MSEQELQCYENDIASINSIWDLFVQPFHFFMKSLENI